MYGSVFTPISNQRTFDAKVRRRYGWRVAGLPSSRLLVAARRDRR